MKRLEIRKGEYEGNILMYRVFLYDGLIKCDVKEIRFVKCV